MENTPQLVNKWLPRLVFSLIFTAIAASIMIVLNPWVGVPKLGWINDYLIKISVGIVLLVFTFLARRSNRFQKY